MKNVKTSLENLSKDSLIENLMLDSIKGGCCGGSSTYKNETTSKETNDGDDFGVILDPVQDNQF